VNHNELLKFCTEADRGNPPHSDTIADVITDVIADAFADVVADAFADAFADVIAHILADALRILAYVTYYVTTRLCILCGWPHHASVRVKYEKTNVSRVY
jgi:hypothetical protein